MCIRKHVNPRKSKLREIFVREIAASAPRVFANVAKDIRELHRQSEVPRAAQGDAESRMTSRRAEHVRAHFADRPGYVCAVGFELVPRPVCDRFQVPADTVKNRVQVFDRHAECRDGPGHLSKDFRAAMTVEGAAQSLPVRSEAVRDTRVTGLCMVDDVVGLPAERVQREHTAPFVSGKQARRERERARIRANNFGTPIGVAHVADPIMSATILPELMTPGTPAPGCVPAPTK
jgi:hypothetical protein